LGRGARYAFAAGGGEMAAGFAAINKKGRTFFFEKKNQKTFINWLPC
jgi:hypothetical protein